MPHTRPMTTASTGERDERANTRPATPTGDIPADTFAARLVLARHHAGRLSIEKAAALCGVNHGSWANWESGARPRDKIEVGQAIASGLGIDLDWLLFGGPLAGPRGVPTKRAAAGTDRPDGLNRRYAVVANRPPDNRPKGGPRSGRQTVSPVGTAAPRRAARIGNPTTVAVTQ